MPPHSHSIKFILIVFLLLALIGSCKQGGEKIATSSEIKKASETAYPLQPFGHDFYGASINLYDDERDIKRILGFPKQKSIEKCNHIPFCATFTYPFGKLELEGEKEGYLYVIGISITAPGVYGPRYTQVGDDIETVLKKFPDEHRSIQNRSRKLYGDMNKIYEKSSNKRRWEELGYGIVPYNDRGEIIEVLYSDGRVGFGSHSLTYKVKKGKVSEITLFVQNV